MEKNTQTSLGKNFTAVQKDNKIQTPPSEMLHLPVVITSQVARNRLEQMRHNIDNVKKLNPMRFPI